MTKNEFSIEHSRNMTRQAVSTRIPGIVLGPSMSYDWFTINKATTDQSQLMLVTKAIPVTLVPKAGAGEGTKEC